MPYIYKITNQINNKVYIGKTTESIEERWRHHKNDAFSPIHSEKMKHRPLYAAIRKYGIENFIIEPIEECSLEELNQKECYWIEYYHSFQDGYNVTCGGDGRPYLDYQLIVNTYNQILNVTKTAQILNIDRDSVTRALIATKSYTPDQIIKNGHAAITHTVGQYDKNGNLIATFSSLAEAEKAVPTGRHICDVCKGKRKTAGGYIWKYL